MSVHPEASEAALTTNDVARIVREAVSYTHLHLVEPECDRCKRFGRDRPFQRMHVQERRLAGNLPVLDRRSTKALGDLGIGDAPGSREEEDVAGELCLVQRSGRRGQKVHTEDLARHLSCLLYTSRCV